jgi:hypothetical protein
MVTVIFMGVLVWVALLGIAPGMLHLATSAPPPARRALTLTSVAPAAPSPLETSPPRPETQASTAA